MTQDKDTELHFNRNDFVINMLDSKRTNWFARDFAKLSDFRNRDNYKGPKNQEDLDEIVKEYTKDGKLGDVSIVKLLYKCYTDPNNPTVQEFQKFWNFIEPIFFEASYIMNNFGNLNPQYLLILNKLDTFDEKAQFEILKRMIGCGIADQKGKNENIGEIIYNKIANNKQATTDYKVMATNALLHKNHDIVRDTIELLKRELDAELKSDSPNHNHIEHISNDANWIMSNLQNSFASNAPYTNNIKNSLSKDYIKTIRDEFDLGKVLAVGTEYIQQIKESLEERAINAERQAHESDKRAQKYEETNIKLNRLQMEYNDIVRQLESEKSKNERLTGELNLLNQQIEKQNSFIKSVQMKIATLKTGLLAGNSVKDLQNFVHKELDR